MINTDEIRASLNKARASGNLSDQSANRLIFIIIDRYLGEDSNAVSRVKLWAEIRPQFQEYFTGTVPGEQIQKIKSGAPIETLGLIEKFKIFGQAFGENAVQSIAPNSKAIGYVFRNAWWILPSLGALYLAPSIINASKKVK